MIKWPERYHPSRAAIHVVNQLTIPAPCEHVWAWLIRAPLWPSWYPNSSDVRLFDQPRSELRLGTMFTWRTFGVKIKSTVQEFIPCERLAWSAGASASTHTMAGCSRANLQGHSSSPKRPSMEHWRGCKKCSCPGG